MRYRYTLSYVDPKTSQSSPVSAGEVTGTPLQVVQVGRVRLAEAKAAGVLVNMVAVDFNHPLGD